MSLKWSLIGSERALNNDVMIRLMAGWSGATWPPFSFHDDQVGGNVNTPMKRRAPTTELRSEPHSESSSAKNNRDTKK